MLYEMPSQIFFYGKLQLFPRPFSVNWPSKVNFLKYPFDDVWSEKLEPICCTPTTHLTAVYQGRPAVHEPVPEKHSLTVFERITQQLTFSISYGPYRLFAHLWGPTIFFLQPLFQVFFGLVFLSLQNPCIFNSPSQSCLSLKHAHTVLPYVAVSR